MAGGVEERGIEGGGMSEEGEGVVERRRRILLGVSGSVACVKVPELVGILQTMGEVRVVWTEHARNFLPAIKEYNSKGWEAYEASLRLEGDGRVEEFVDADEWGPYSKVGDPVLHIELRKWADLILLAPLSANTLAKITHGLCDNLLSCVMRAWEIGKKPIVVAPAMNTAMWEHPLTAEQIAVLSSRFGAVLVDPASKLLACGDVGKGAMAPVTDITQAIALELQNLDKKEKKEGVEE